MDNQAFVYDTEQYLFSNNFSRVGYVFANWTTSDDGTGTSYTDQQSVLNLTTISDDVVTLYAQWTPNHYTVSFDSNGGTGFMPEQAFIYDIEQALSDNQFTRKGYTLNGWKNNDSGITYELGEVINLSVDEGTALTFYAQWRINQYMVSYDLNGGNFEEGASFDTTFTLASDDINVSNPVRRGYNFTGWNFNITIGEGSNDVVELNANWSPIESDDTPTLDPKVQEIFNSISEDSSPLTDEQISTIIDSPSQLNSELSNTLVNNILSNETPLDDETITNLVEKTVVADDGTLDSTVMETITSELTSSNETTETGATVLSAEDITNSDSTAAKMVVAALTSSVEKSDGELKLKDIPLTSTSGISTLVQTIADGTSKETSELTLDLSGMGDQLTKIDNLEGLEVEGIKLENTSVTEVDLSQATKIENVSMTNSQVTQLTLGKESNVTNIDASGSESLESVDIEGNPYIETLDISGTNVASLNAENCANLKTLAVEGDAENGGSLENVNLEGCDNLEELTLSNNKLLGIERPSSWDDSKTITFRARGQRRSSDEFVLSQQMNMWEFLWDVWQSSLEDDDPDKGEYTPESQDVAPFDVSNIVSVNGVTPNENGDVEFDSIPTSITYEYEAGFNNAATARFTTADGEDSLEGMDVTIEGPSNNKNH